MHPTVRSLQDFPSDRVNAVLGNLKLCPLCGALNSRQNGECFVCRWHGRFATDRESLRGGLRDLVERCPDMAEALLDPKGRRPTWWQRLSRRFRRRTSLRL